MAKTCIRNTCYTIIHEIQFIQFKLKCETIQSYVLIVCIRILKASVVYLAILNNILEFLVVIILIYLFIVGHATLGRYFMRKS